MFWKFKERNQKTEPSMTFTDAVSGIWERFHLGLKGTFSAGSMEEMLRRTPDCQKASLLVQLETLSKLCEINETLKRNEAEQS